MFVPVSSVNPLCPQEALNAVRRLGERPLAFEVRPEAYDKDAMPVLRHTIVRRIQQPINHAVEQFTTPATCMPSL
ncbi:protein of unknown function [Candidatus Nitrospira inopinata]|uniref:Uncharacterized protein n=1 Tax=Candidatus Nitrospira inopinata TaxID=1715989 RepID=A0A0S4KRF2_9BACT|nr:protein of unknown function [Candidatus Nitrospira inopinata]